jgi:nucleoside-diphosphate-sugar epimerase
MRNALVLGGTGPTGPYIIEGLASRGYDVTMVHSGAHEAEIDAPVRDVHADAYFRESLEAAIGTSSFDVVIAAYGRLQMTAELFRSRTGHFVGIGAQGAGSRLPSDPAWGPMGPAVNVAESADLLLEQEQPNYKLGFKMAEARRAVLRGHADSAYTGTYVGYPVMYGPRQPGCQDWCVVRRILDGRKNFVVADGGLKIEARGFAANMAHAVLLVVDNPEVSGGKAYAAQDARQFTLGQRIRAICAHLGSGMELVSLPYGLAWPCQPMWKHRPRHRFRDIGLIQRELSYTDCVSVEDGIAQSVDWLLANKPLPGGPDEQIIGDPFDYAAEDALLAWWRGVEEAGEALQVTLPTGAHQYRHPKQPGEAWHPPADSLWRSQE